MGRLRGRPLKLHLVVPGPLDQRTGGYLYDARMVEELRGRGWEVDVHELEGRFPASPGMPGAPESPEARALEAVLAALPDGARVLLDGLAMGGMPDPGPLSRHGARLVLVSLVHHPLFLETGLTPARAAELEGSEARALAHCRGVITTSAHTAGEVEALGVPRERIRVVSPGTALPEAAPGARPTAAPAAGQPAAPTASLHPGPHLDPPPLLLAVGSVVPRKGYPVLVSALAALPGPADEEEAVAGEDATGRRGWRCRVVGSLARDPAHAALLREAVAEAGLQDRISFTGECSPAELEASYAEAELFVLPSLHEGYGMVLTEAMARGLPVVSTTAGAIPQTLGVGPGAGPGGADGADEAVHLVPPGDAEALAQGLARALAVVGDPHRRSRAREAARARARALPGWPAQAALLEAALLALGMEAPAGSLPEEDRPDHATFSGVWLSLREPVDHASRDPELEAALTGWVQGAGAAAPGPLRVVDLGSGTGSNRRHLGPILARALPAAGAPAPPPTWCLVDHDPALLEQAARGAEPPGELLLQVGDLATVGLEAVAEAEVVTASALLDLVSEAWLHRLVAASAAARGGLGAAALLVLTYDGGQRWTPADPDDPLLLQGVNLHQRLDKGLGPALGPAATEAAGAAFRARGYRVVSRPSPWVLGPEHAPLVRPLVEGWVEAAVACLPEHEARLREWGARRLAHVASDESWQLEVGHQDLLALPPEAP